MNNNSHLCSAFSDKQPTSAQQWGAGQTKRENEAQREEVTCPKPESD